MSASILFYGYNLGAPEDSGWAIKGDDLDFEPDWLIEWERDTDDLGVDHYMRRAILLANGTSEEEIIKGDDGALLAERCSLEVVTFGHFNTLFYGLAIAGLVHRADDWSPTVIGANQLSENLIPYFSVVDRLGRALGVMGMDLIQEAPSWILAPQE